MFTNAEGKKFAKNYLADIKAAWDLVADGNPWWMQCQCGFTRIAAYEPSENAVVCANCFTDLSPTCDDQSCNSCTNGSTFPFFQ